MPYAINFGQNPMRIKEKSDDEEVKVLQVLVKEFVKTEFL